MSEQQPDTPVLNLLAKMTSLALEATSLDERDVVLVRLAALVASDAPPISYALNLGTAGDLDMNVNEIRGVFAAIAPIVGTARVVTALANIAKIDAFAELAPPGASD
jgi:4-carboxymuconolactone decarboxylase